jgi:prepilin-type N-terminal cleavage/methylation domain-containing protein
LEHAAYFCRVHDDKKNKANVLEGGRRYPLKRAFTLVELLVVLAILAILISIAVNAIPDLIHRAERSDALAKTRTMGTAVLLYAADHQGQLPPLFPGQVLEYEPGRGGRIVTECAEYLQLTRSPEKYLVRSLLPKAYARLREPADQNTMRVWVMNSMINSGDEEIRPFGTLGPPGLPPTNPAPLARIFPHNLWMISTADRQQPNVASASWRASAPPLPPLGNYRAVFHFDGSAGLENIP